MKSYKVCFALVCAFAVVSCGGKSGSGDSKVQPLGVISGKYEVTQAVDWKYTNHYNVGCEKPGLPNATYQVDPRLKKGMSFTSSMQIQGGSQNMSAVVSKTIKSLTATGYKANTKVLTASGFSNLSSGSEFVENCYIENGTKCDLEPSVQIQLPAQDCKVTDWTPLSSEYNLGRFTTTNGKVLNTYESKGTSKIKLECNSYSGEGTFEFRGISSNDIPSTSFSYCGGTQVYYFGTMKKADGTVLYSISMETLAF